MTVFESFLGVNPWTALFVLLNTLTVFFVARHYLFIPVMKIIESRQKEIKELYADANTAKENAIALEAEHKAKLTAAAQTGAQIIKEAQLRGQNREEEIIRQANAEAAAIIDKANASIAQEKKKAINDTKDEISVISVAIAQKVVARELRAKDHQQLVDDFIDRLGEAL